MAAREDINSSSRLERVKPILYDIVDSMKELGQVKMSLYGFTEIARSLVPFVGIEDYFYLKESVKKVLDIYSTPGSGTSLGKSIQNVIAKFSEGAQAKIIVLISDGEPYINDTRGMTYHENIFINAAIKQAVEEGIKVITIGVGEREGAKIPVYDSDGEFTGSYAKQESDIDYITYLEEEGLREIAFQTGGEYFYEENLEGLTEFIEENLYTVNTDGVKEDIKVYHSTTHWFLLASLPFWIVLAKRHLLQ
jgi:Ca-activated chloride channel family protein